METRTYFQSITRELQALQDRVRNFIDDRHWQTDGEWKESVLRVFLRRCLPRNVEIGRGFVVGPSFTSTQIDILLYTIEKPVLFRDGGLVFVAPDAVLGMIEVKTSLDNASFSQAVRKLGDNIYGVSERSPHERIVGLFAYEEGAFRWQEALQLLQEAADGNLRRVVNVCSVGTNLFFRWWNLDPIASQRVVDRWHAYHYSSNGSRVFHTQCS
jgi:hypothetical protein